MIQEIFNFAQFSLITDNKAVDTEKTYSPLTKYYTPQNRISINLPRNDIFLKRKCCNSIQKQTKVNSFASAMHIGETLTSATVGMKLYHSRTIISVISTT